MLNPIGVGEVFYKVIFCKLIMSMEYIFSNYGIEIVVGMIISVLVFIFLRVLYFGYIKKESKN